MKRPIISERMFLYWTDREHPNTCRMTVRMHWQSKEGADRVDQMPTVAARHEAMKGLTQRTQTMTSCFISRHLPGCFPRRVPSVGY